MARRKRSSRQAQVLKGNSKEALDKTFFSNASKTKISSLHSCHYQVPWVDLKLECGKDIEVYVPHSRIDAESSSDEVVLNFNSNKRSSSVDERDADEHEMQDPEMHSPSGKFALN